MYYYVATLYGRYLKWHFLLGSWRHKANGCTSVWTLYKEPLGEILVYHNNVYKSEKGPRWGIYSIIKSIWTYFCTHLRFSVCFPVKSHFTSLQGIYYFSYCCYLLVPCQKHYEKHYILTLRVEVSFIPTLVLMTSFRISSIVNSCGSPNTLHTLALTLVFDFV